MSDVQDNAHLLHDAAEKAHAAARVVWQLQKWRREVGLDPDKRLEIIYDQFHAAWIHFRDAAELLDRSHGDTPGERGGRDA